MLSDSNYTILCLCYHSKTHIILYYFIRHPTPHLNPILPHQPINLSKLQTPVDSPTPTNTVHSRPLALCLRNAATSSTLHFLLSTTLSPKGRRLNTCKWCPLRACSSSKSLIYLQIRLQYYSRAEIESKSPQYSHTKRFSLIRDPLIT